MPASTERRRAASDAFGLVALCVLSACSAAQGRQPLPDWSNGYDDSSNTVKVSGERTTALSGAVQFGLHSDLPAEGMGVAISDGVTWPMRIRQLGTADTPCAVHGTMDGQSHEIECVLEMDELDVWTLGVKFDIVVPAGECDFVLTDWYRYENFEVGPSPTNVSWTVDLNGMITEEKNAFGGKPDCPYDYSKRGRLFPNCCEGGYTQKITSSATGVVSVIGGTWNGRVGDCYDGAGYLDVDAVLDDAGFPVAKYYYLGRSPFLKTAKFKGLSGIYASLSADVPLASFYRPSEHKDDKGNDDAPAPLKAPFAVAKYNIWCEDDAKEEISHITITVREWNEEKQFDADGDPDTTGLEPGWNGLCGDGPQREDCPIDDIPDWDVLTPDDTSYPMLLRHR